MVSSLPLLHAVLGTLLLAAVDAGRVERAADDVVAHAGEVAHAAPAHEDDRVLLQVVALAGDVRGDLAPVRETDAGDLAQRRVRLLRGRRLHDEADAALLGARLQHGALGPAAHLAAALAHQLVDRRHAGSWRRTGKRTRPSPGREAKAAPRAKPTPEGRSARGEGA